MNINNKTKAVYLKYSLDGLRIKYKNRNSRGKAKSTIPKKNYIDNKLKKIVKLITIIVLIKI